MLESCSWFIKIQQKRIVIVKTNGSFAALVLTLDTVPICNEMQQQAPGRAQAAPRAETGDNC